MAYFRWFLSSAALLLAVACLSPTGEPGERSLTGDWCTLGALGPAGLPVDEAAWVGGQLNQTGDQILGSGSVKRADDDELFPSRFEGLIIGERLSLTAVPTSAAPEGGPVLELDLAIEGPNDLVGSVSGDPGLAGSITLVRLGPRCFDD